MTSDLPQKLHFACRRKNLSMTAVLIVAHAPLASALLAVAGHAYPECAAGVGAVDILEGDSLQVAESAVRAAMARFGGSDVLILSDAFGATPCNASMQVADGVHVRVVTGVNVPMLWRTLCYSGDSLDSLVSRAVIGASQGVMQVASTRPQNQNPSSKPTSNDQVQGPHQQ